MAIFRNKEGDLPPLIPSAKPEKPTTEQKAPRSADSAGLPSLPDHVIQQPSTPRAARSMRRPARRPETAPTQQAPAPAESVPAIPAAPEVQAAPAMQPVQEQSQPAPVETAPTGPQFDQQIEQVKRPESLEASIQQGPEQQEQARQQEAEGSMRRRRRKKQQDDQQPADQAAQGPVVPDAKTPERMEIEQILSQGVAELYQAMTPQEQEAFRLKGEETATAIERMVLNLKASTRKVVGLIRDWLQTIPGVNKYFLEQESKLKTDEIMKYQRKVKKERKSRITL